MVGRAQRRARSRTKGRRIRAITARNRRQCNGIIALSSYAVLLDCSLIRSEDEQLVLLDRTADHSSKLVLIEHSLRLARQVQEEVIGVQSRIPEKLEGGSVDSISAGFGHDVDVGP